MAEQHHIGARAVMGADREVAQFPRAVRYPPHPEGTKRWIMIVRLIFGAALLVFFAHLAESYRDYAVIVAVTEAKGDALRARCAIDPPTDKLSDWGRVCVAAAAQAPFPYIPRQEREASTEAASR